MFGKTVNFIGFKNYEYMFTTDPYFLQSLKVTLIFVAIAVPLKLGFALFVAMLLNTDFRGISFFRTVYYVPSILGGSVAIAVLWRVLYYKDGIINTLLTSIGLPAISFFGSSESALFTIALLTVWQFGSSMVLFLAAIKQIPHELYEAARVDGASNVHMFFKITLPQITPIIQFNLVMQTIFAFQEFTSAYVITKGGPLKGTYLLGMKLYEDAFKNYKVGYASAESWVMFIIILIVTLLIFRSSKKWVYYADGGEEW
jgi:oligogalacturonide transport system permease protein